MVRSFNTARVICVEMFYPLDFQAIFFILLRKCSEQVSEQMSRPLAYRFGVQCLDASS